SVPARRSRPSSPSCRFRLPRAASGSARRPGCPARAPRSPPAHHPRARARRGLITSRPVGVRGFELPHEAKGTVMDSTHERPPYGAYAAIMGIFAGGLAAAGMVARALDRDPQCHTTLDFVVLGAASFKAAHTLSHDEVTSFIREP